jgi:Na+/H+ antiporter NhaD/arsenite permease-like protein
MADGVEFGLHLIADDATLTFIFFVGMVLLAAIAARFGAYAYMNVRAADGTDQRVLWEYLFYVGAVAAVYGLVGILEVVSSIRAPF